MADVRALVSDPDFQKLSPAEQRQALSGVSGDQSFSSLNDEDTAAFVSRMSPPPVAQMSANPNPPPQKAFRKFQGPFIERATSQFGEDLADTKNLLPSAKSLLHTAFLPFTLPMDVYNQTKELYQQAHQPAPDLAETVGHLGVPALMTILTGGASELPNPAEMNLESLPNPRAALRSRLYKELPPSGGGPVLTKGASAVSKGLGAAGGAAVGNAVPIPGAGYAGGVAGFEAGPSILRKIIGKPEVGEITNPGPYSKIPSRVPASVIREQAPTPAGNLPFSPSQTAFLPEPRTPFTGEQTGYMSSVPRDTLTDLALTRKPGAGQQLQQLGQPVIYIPQGSELPVPPKLTRIPMRKKK